MGWYHGVNNVERVKKNGLTANYGRFGKAVYFTNDKDYARIFGENIVELIGICQ